MYCEYRPKTWYRRISRRGYTVGGREGAAPTVGEASIGREHGGSKGED